MVTSRWRGSNRPPEAFANQRRERGGRCGRKITLAICGQRNPNAWLEGRDLSAAYALKTARALGIRVCLDGDDLELEASLPPPEWLPFTKEPIVISVRTKSN